MRVNKYCQSLNNKFFQINPINLKKLWFINKINVILYIIINTKYSVLFIAIMEDPQVLQKKLYFLVEQLQNMARDLPPKYQMRVPYELLSSLANCLLNETIFEIVKGLMEIQHVTEKHLYQQRLELKNKHKLEEQRLLIHTSDSSNDLEKLKAKQKDELKEFDKSLVMQLDEKVADQQSILEQAGVPGFYITSNQLEVKVQMHLLDFILRLSKMSPSV